MGEVVELGGNLLFSVWFGAMALLWMSVLWRRWGPSRAPRPMQTAIEELTAHKVQHQIWVEGQRLAMAWWEQQCACPEPKTFEQEVTELSRQYHDFRTGSHVDELNRMAEPWRYGQTDDRTILLNSYRVR